MILDSGVESLPNQQKWHFKHSFSTSDIYKSLFSSLTDLFLVVKGKGSKTLQINCSLEELLKVLRMSGNNHETRGIIIYIFILFIMIIFSFYSSVLG